MIALMLTAALAGSTSAQVIPTTYEAGHFYASPRTKDGQQLRLLVDTGGGGSQGMYWLKDAVVERLHLKKGKCDADDDHVIVVPSPTFMSGQALPASIGACPGMLLVFSGDADYDGQLGSGYLGTRVWTFDYPHQRLVAERTNWKHETAAHSTPLGFQKNAQGKVVQYFPRVVVHVQGQLLNMLLDTGATAHPTAAGKSISGTPTVNGFGVTSYLTTSVFNRWHSEHPDWKVEEKGDDLFAPGFLARLIEVPRLEIAGVTVGPIWFTERPDRGFHETLDDIMDEPPVGAVGGNVLSHFKLTIDYPHATAWFTCAQGCGP